MDLKEMIALDFYEMIKRVFTSRRIWSIIFSISSAGCIELGLNSLATALSITAAGLAGWSYIKPEGVVANGEQKK